MIFSNTDFTQFINNYSESDMVSLNAQVSLTISKLTGKPLSKLLIIWNKLVWLV